MKKAEKVKTSSKKPFRQWGNVSIDLPNPLEVQNELSKTIENLDFFIELLLIKNRVTFFEFLAHNHTINMELLQIWHKIRLLTITGKKYSKAFEKLKKILIKIVVDTNQVKRKHVGDSLLEWESVFQEGKMRKDLIKHLKGISKQLKKILKDIGFN